MGSMQPGARRGRDAPALFCWMRIFSSSSISDRLYASSRASCSMRCSSGDSSLSSPPPPLSCACSRCAAATCLRSRASSSAAACWLLLSAPLGSASSSSHSSSCTPDEARRTGAEDAPAVGRSKPASEATSVSAGRRSGDAKPRACQQAGGAATAWLQPSGCHVRPRLRSAWRRTRGCELQRLVDHRVGSGLERALEGGLDLRNGCL